MLPVIWVTCGVVVVIAAIRAAWEPNHHLFISLLIAFETAVGLLVLTGRRLTQLGYVAAIAFHVALLSFGWGFYVWSIPMIGAFSLLLRAQRQPSSSPVVVVVPDARAA